MSDANPFLLLSPETRIAFRRIAAQHQSTGFFPRSRAAARHIAEAANAAVADVLVLAGFKDRNASAPARQIAKFLHGRKLK